LFFVYFYSAINSNIRTCSIESFCFLSKLTFPCFQTFDDANDESVSLNFEDNIGKQNIVTRFCFFYL